VVFARSPNRISLPGYDGPVGPHIVLFEVCSAFTHVAACTLALSPIRDTLIEGFSHFVTSMTAPIASGWSEFAGWDSHPPESAAFARRNETFTKLELNGKLSTGFQTGPPDRRAKRTPLGHVLTAPSLRWQVLEIVRPLFLRVLLAMKPPLPRNAEAGVPFRAIQLDALAWVSLWFGAGWNAIEGSQTKDTGQNKRCVSGCLRIAGIQSSSQKRFSYFVQCPKLS
jgi:hypothetical protein